MNHYHVMFNALEMPDATACAGVQRNHAIGEKIVADTISAIEIKRSRASGAEHHAEFRVDAQAGPRIRAAGDLVRLRRPGVVAELAGMRDGVKNPAPLLSDVVTSNARMSPGEPGRVSGTVLPMIQQVFEDLAGTAGADGHVFGRAIEPFPKIDAAVVAEPLNRFTCATVERPQVIAMADEHAVFIYGDAAMAIAPLWLVALIGVETPDFTPGLGIERDHAQLGRGGIEDAIDDDGIALHLRIFEGVVRVVRPDNLKAGDVIAIDLLQLGIADVIRAAIDRPLDVGGLDKRGREQERDQLRCRNTHRYRF